MVTEPLQFEVVAGGPKLTDVQPRRIILDGGVKEITIVGSGFGDTDDPQYPPNVYPGVAASGERVRVLGRILTFAGSGGPDRVEILFGRRGENPKEIGVDEFEVAIPADISAGSAPVKFVRPDETFTQELQFEVVVSGP